MIRLKELLSQIVEKRAARMAENDAATAAKFAGMQDRDDVELAKMRVPATNLDLAKQGMDTTGMGTGGPTIPVAIEKDKRSGMQSDKEQSKLKTAYDDMINKSRDKEVFGGVRGKVQDLPADIKPIAQAAQKRYDANMAKAQAEFDKWDQQRKDAADKEAAQKAAVKAASVRQRGNQYMNAPSVGNVELPQDNDAVDLSTLDQTALDNVRTAYEKFMRSKPSGADATEYMRLLLRKNKLPPNTNPFGNPSQS